MKKIILIRHAKSAWDDLSLSDHDRPLADRGLHDAPIMAKRLKKRRIYPEIILSSTAKRAKETAKIIAKELEFPVSEVILEGNLYHASPNKILKYIHQQNDSKETMIVVGHNPGFNDLIEYLGGKLDNLPTSGQFGFLMKADSWSKFGPNTAEVWFVDYPKKKF